MVKIRDILDLLRADGEISFRGKEDAEITGFSSVTNYQAGTVTWCKTAETAGRMAAGTMRFKLVIMPPSPQLPDNFENIIITEKPKKIFFDIVEQFFAENRQLPDVGQGTYISVEAVIGKNVKIGYNCVMDGKITIEDDTVIYNNVTMINKVHVGKRCVIHSGTVIGHDDFAYVEDECHNKKMIKHYGGVDIGDDVFIGANCAINRGTIDDTVIGEGTKIDGFCHISHNVCLGRKNALVSGTRIYGSVRTGENAYIASSIIKNQLHIGDNAVVGMGSVVIRDVNEDDVVAGVPAKSIKEK